MPKIVDVARRKARSQLPPMNLARKLPKRSDDGYTFRDQRVLEWTPFEAIGIPLSFTITTALRSGRIWALPPERGCVRRTSRSTPECQAVVKRPQCAARVNRCGWCSARRAPFPNAFRGQCPDAPLRISCGKKLLTRLGDSRVFDPGNCLFARARGFEQAVQHVSTDVTADTDYFCLTNLLFARPAAKFHGGKRVSDESKQAPERRQPSSATARGFPSAHAPSRVL